MGAGGHRPVLQVSAGRRLCTDPVSWIDEGGKRRRHTLIPPFQLPLAQPQLTPVREAKPTTGPGRLQCQPLCHAVAQRASGRWGPLLCPPPPTGVLAASHGHDMSTQRHSQATAPSSCASHSPASPCLMWGLTQGPIWRSRSHLTHKGAPFVQAWGRLHPWEFTGALMGVWWVRERSFSVPEGWSLRKDKN